MQIHPIAPPARRETRVAPTAGNDSDPTTRRAPPTAFAQFVSLLSVARARTPARMSKTTLTPKSDHATNVRERTFTRRLCPGSASAYKPLLAGCRPRVGEPVRVEVALGDE